MAPLLAQLAGDPVITQAYQWLCRARACYHHNDDVWPLRRRWDHLMPVLQSKLRAGTYRFSACRRLHRPGTGPTDLWAAQDSLVLKALAVVLTEHLRPHLSARCYHLAGTGGLKAAVREVHAQLPAYTFVFRTDVKGYYASINHAVAEALLMRHLAPGPVLGLVRQYLARTVCDGGRYIDIGQGISLGCPLSPLMGALYLKPLDDRMAELGCCYVRYMDDWVVLARTRWHLRAAIRAVNEQMALLRVSQHPDKTTIGRISRGFDFLGYRFSDKGLQIAKPTLQRCAEKMTRLYEQDASEERIGEYGERWLRWVGAGLGEEGVVGVSGQSCAGGGAKGKT